MEETTGILLIVQIDKSTQCSKETASLVCVNNLDATEGVSGGVAARCTEEATHLNIFQGNAKLQLARLSTDSLPRLSWALMKLGKPVPVLKCSPRQELEVWDASITTGTETKTQRC